MSNLALWSRPAWDTDRWLRDFFGPAAAADWHKPATSGFTPGRRDRQGWRRRGGTRGTARRRRREGRQRRGGLQTGSRLVIHGEHRDEHSEEKNGRTLREIRYGSFRRSFQLPAHVTSEAIAASYDAGVLTVRVTGAYAGSSGAAHRDH